MCPNTRRSENLIILFEELVYETILTFVMVEIILGQMGTHRSFRRQSAPYRMLERIPEQVRHLNRVFVQNDTDCISNLRMDRNTFGRLCFLLRELGGLHDGKYVTIEEQVALFLSILGHHKKNWIVKFNYLCSGQTVSHYVHVVLKSILKLHALILVKPEPVEDDCTDPKWKWFKGCLGALDGTYIDVKVPAADKPRYRTQKGTVATNVLAVCNRQMRFVYVLPGWECSAADARILRDAINRPHGLQVPRGSYDLVDNGYANSEGFLAPYKSVRYHLNEWGQCSMRPRNMKEHFNMRHTRARNIIERAFGVMKTRWGILRSASYYPIKVQVRLITACFILHNFIRGEMLDDPFEQLLDTNCDVNDDAFDETEHVDAINSSADWNH